MRANEKGRQIWRPSGASLVERCAAAFFRHVAASRFADADHATIVSGRTSMAEQPGNHHGVERQLAPAVVTRAVGVLGFSSPRYSSARPDGFAARAAGAANDDNATLALAPAKHLDLGGNDARLRPRPPEEHAVAFKSMLRRRGVRVVSITEHDDDSPTGRLMEAIIESVAEFYSENLPSPAIRQKHGSLLNNDKRTRVRLQNRR